jgi:hypothetical protein
MKLVEIVDNRFTQLKGLMQAAASGRYIEGRDNVGMYALPGSRKKNTLLDHYKRYGFGELFQEVLKVETDRQQDTKHSVLIRGPLSMDAVVDMWLSVKYFLENARDFHIVDGGPVGGITGNGDKWEYMVKAVIPGTADEAEQTVLRANGDDYVTSTSGPLRGNKYFRISMASDRHMILPDVLGHKNDFSFSTYDFVDGEYKFPKETNFDVHLNGPNNHVIIHDLLELGNAIKEHCLESAK